MGKFWDKSRMNGEGPEISILLNQAARGDSKAAGEVFRAIYQELRRLASAKLARLPAGGSLRTTDLVHDAWLRIVPDRPQGWDGRRHFFFAASRAMRDILVEEARRKASLKRGGDVRRVPLEEIACTFDAPPDDILDLDAALRKLELDDPEGHRLVLLRFFAGLTAEEIAEALETSVRTVERRWRFLRVWLARELER
jgi:RNA polymerase sigma factor (TIGR02999 family)